MAQEQRDQPAQQSAAPAPLAGLMGLLQRWNFIERARLERELWDAFERGEPIEQLVEACEPGFRREVWSTTAVRIRKIERMMRDQQQPPGGAG
jgi:hypothetical protein